MDYSIIAFLVLGSMWLFVMIPSIENNKVLQMIFRGLLVLTNIFILSVVLSQTSNAATITVSGDTLTYKGGVEEGDAKKFKKLFTYNIKKLVLNSPGGYMNEAYKMSKLISKRYDVTITTKKTCTSACAVMWLSGNSQTKPAAKVVGFHLPYIPDIKDIKEQQDKYGLNGLEYMFKKSVLGFLVKVTPYIDNQSTTHMFTKGLLDKGLLSYNMWYPTLTELESMEGKFTKPKPKAAAHRSLSDSKGWANSYTFKDINSRYVNGIWETKITISYDGYAKNLYLSLFTGSGSKATQLKVGGSQSEIKWSRLSWTLDAIIHGNAYIYTIKSSVKPTLIQMEDSDGNKVWTYI